MSDSTATLRRKIEGARELRGVVRTMKAAAAASVTQFEQSARALEAYDRAVTQGLGACLRRGAAPLRPSLGPPPACAAVVFGSDQGLVGRFNDAIAEHAIAALATTATPPRIWAVGQRVHARLVDAGLRPVGAFPTPVSVAGITPLVGQLLLEGQAQASLDAGGALFLFHNQPRPGATYAPTGQQLLPLDERWRRAVAATAWPTPRPAEIIENAPADTLRALIGEHLFVSIFRACAESLASENASRLAAMQRADRNIGELLDTLRRRFHQLRQGGIDAELFDVISGFEALGKPRGGS